jgi:hypothetical protein
VSDSVSDVLALIQGPDVVGDQWRVCQPFRRLRQAGINARWARLDDSEMPPTDPEATILVVRLLTGTDEAAIDRWFADWRPRVRAIVYEMDDICWGEAAADHLEAADFTQGRTRAQILYAGEMARYAATQCDGVIVSSEPLAEYVRAGVDRPVLVVPNAIDVRWFRAQMAHRPAWADHLTIGWCGGRRPEADLVPMAQAWGRIARRYPHVRFVVASPVIPDVIYREIEDDSRIIRLPWVPWDESPTLYQVDIGCCAVSDTPFSRCKTPIKAWEYAVAGAAVLTSPTLYRDCIPHAGPKPKTADDWEYYLDFYVRCDAARENSQHDWTRHVERHHALDTQLHRWPEALEQIVKVVA